MLPTFFLQHALTMPQSYEYIINLCKIHPNYCKENKERLCRKILKLSNYTVFPNNTEYCKIYKELADVARYVQGPHKESYIALKLSDGSINTTLLEMLEGNTSPELASFLNANGYAIDESPRFPSPVWYTSIQSSPTRIIPRE
jgi:hypothetical protein